jgi:anti-sigma factor RsiW
MKMSEHERMRDLMGLASAGALEMNEERELMTHVAGCADCAAELDRWRELGSAMRRLPTPQAPARMVERTRAAMMALALGRIEQRASRRAMAWLILLAWTTTLASWPILRMVSSGAASWLDVSFVHTWQVLVGWTLVSWIAAVAAAVVLGLRHRQERGLA